MKDLIAKLEAAETGSREFDAEIAEHLGHEITWSLGGYTTDANGGPTIHWKAPHHYAGMKEPCPSYTTSIDAALTLVPEGWTPTIMKWSPGPWGIWVAMSRKTGHSALSEAAANTEALALCIAALKARDES